MDRRNGEPAQTEHNLEDWLQELKEMEMVKLQNTYGFKIVCKICFGINKTQTEKPASTNDCPTHKGNWEPLRVHQESKLKIRPLPNKWIDSNPINLCRHSRCWNKEQCSWAHNYNELYVWRAEQAIKYPRPCPPPNCTGAPRLCKDMNEKKTCEQGHRCAGAHSNVELRIWQIKSETQLPEWQKEVEAAVSEAVHLPHTKDRLKEIHTACTKISTDHEAQLGHVVKTAAKTLIQHEVKQRESDTRQSPHQQHRSHVPSESDDYEYPFMQSYVDYARRCEDQLSLSLHIIINAVDLTESSHASTVTDNSINGDHQYDSRKLLSHMKEYTDQYANQFSMDSDLLYCYCMFLKTIENQLAHQGYLTGQDPEGSHALSIVGRKAYIETFLEYSHDLIAKICQSKEFQVQVPDLQAHTKELKRVQDLFKEYCYCKKRHDINKAVYSRLSEREQERVAEKVVKQLQERIQTNKCCQQMLGTYIPALTDIDITALADSISSEDVPVTQSEDWALLLQTLGKEGSHFN